MRFSTLLPITLLLISCGQEPKIETQLQGAWEINQVIWTSKDTSIVINPSQKGLFILTNEFYSICWSPINQPRNSFKNLSNPTDPEIIDGFRSIVFNSGQYIQKKDTLITTASIAKVPGFENGIQYYSYHLDTDELELTLFDETYPNNQKPSWSGRWKTHFKLKKLQEKNIFN